MAFGKACADMFGPRKRLPASKMTPTGNAASAVHGAITSPKATNGRRRSMRGSASKNKPAYPPGAYGQRWLSHVVSPVGCRWDSEKVRELGVCLRCLTCLT